MCQVCLSVRLSRRGEGGVVYVLARLPAAQPGLIKISLTNPFIYVEPNRPNWLLYDLDLSSVYAIIPQQNRTLALVRLR